MRGWYFELNMRDLVFSKYAWMTFLKKYAWLGSEKKYAQSGMYIR